MANKEQQGRRGRRPVIGIAALFIVAAALPVALATAAETGEHAPLDVDASLTLAEVVTRTVENDPGYPELAARSAEADAWKRRGGSLTAGPAMASFRFQTDRWDQDVGLQEIESGIQLALWKWGQRRSTRALGNSLEAESEAATRALRWEIAGLLRRLLWELAGAEAGLELAEQSATIAGELAASVRRRYELGDAAERDVLLADSAELAAAAAVTDAEVALVDAQRTWRMLTGLDRRPVLAPEPLAKQDGIEIEHPALAMASAAVERSQAARELARDSGMGSPTLMIGPRRERSTSAQDYEDSIGIFLTVPFGGGSHIRTQVTAAGRQVAAAQAELQATVRELELAMHEAEHSLSAAGENLDIATRRAELARRGLEMGEIALEQGEIGLMELLRLQEVYLDARRQVIRFDIDVKLQTALYNQAVGVTP